MKYARLTKEQFEELNAEFINFLASQAIDKDEWDLIKANKPSVAEQELDVFSDLVWEGVLNTAAYLDHYSNNQIVLFRCLECSIHSIIVKTKVSGVDFLSKDGLQWLSDNIFTDAIELQIGTKAFSGERNLAIFDLIIQGASLSDGKLYIQINQLIES